MTKSEKNAIADVIGMLNAVLTDGNSDGNQPTGDLKNPKEEASPADDSPSQEEINFVRELANDGKIVIRGYTINYTTESVGKIGISSDCLSRLLEAYLEKYDHE
jgi:hypothetical protein